MPFLNLITKYKLLIQWPMIIMKTYYENYLEYASIKILFYKWKKCN